MSAPNPPAALTLDEAARRIGRYVWVERTTFETLGRWVPDVPETDVKIVLARQAPHHAWHAELWEERLPRLQERDGAGLVEPPHDQVAAFFSALAGPDGGERTIERLVGAYRVLAPRKIAAYTAHLRQTSAITDGPTIRCLRLVLHDELDDWREGELLLQSLLSDPDSVDRAAVRQARLEQMVVAAGGIAASDGADRPPG